MRNHPDIVVVGAGNAAFCAARAARESGASVLMLERAPEAESGGNSRFTAGAFRFAYDGADDIRQLCPDLSEDLTAITDFGAYPQARFYDDMFRLTGYRTDPDLCETLVADSRDAIQWLHGKGIAFMPIYGRQAFKVDGRFRFWGGLTLEARGGGPGLIDRHTSGARGAGIDIRYGARALGLIHDGHTVSGVRVKQDGRVETVPARAVVLAAGGFQADPAWRTRYLGPGWDRARVRGSRFSTGDGIRMALEIGAASCGNWSGGHAVAWDYNAPEFGDLAVGDGFQKHSYPWGVMVNAHGRRFVDEGADFRNYTYARYGRAILEQPDGFAWQVFDARVAHLLRDEYRIRQVTKAEAGTLEELAGRLEGVDAGGFLAELTAYNAAVDTGTPFDPTVKDGRGTRGLAVNKTNWANPISEPPFAAFRVGCGLTFTFGGLRIDPASAQVLDSDLAPIPGLYAAGELVGGLFWFNYPGGAGLTAGTVFGRLAGRSAAEAAGVVRHDVPICH